MTKPQILTEYSAEVTRDCERVLVTLFSGLGPWRDSVFLVGGLAPRYIVTKRPPDVPPHAGTGDIDVVVDLSILADIVAFTCLKAFAFDHRRERKDAHDLVYCLEHGEGGLAGAIAKFQEALKGRSGRHRTCPDVIAHPIL
jgi:hypothetical protein